MKSAPAAEIFVLHADFADSADCRVLGFFDNESVCTRGVFCFPGNDLLWLRNESRSHGYLL
jgi:hypothetical protein